MISLLHDLKKRKVRVLFVCLGNSCRSRMAQAFAEAWGSDVLEASSAGFAPATRVSRTAQAVVRECGLEIEDTPPRRFTLAELNQYDLIVNLCEYGLPKTNAPVLKRAVPDPIGKDADFQRNVRDRIERAVWALILQLRQGRDQWSWEAPAAEKPRHNVMVMPKIPAAPAPAAAANRWRAAS